MKLERSVTQLERKASDIDVRFDIDDREIRRADRLHDNLTRSRRVKLQVDERIQRDTTPGATLIRRRCGVPMTPPSP